MESKKTRKVLKKTVKNAMKKSRALMVANALLLLQIGAGLMYLVWMLLQLLNPASGFAMENQEWARILSMMLVGAALLFVVNRKDGKMFAPRLPREEKMFKMAAWGVFDVAICLSLSYLLSLPMEQSTLSLNSVTKSLGGALAVAGVFLALAIAVPVVKVFNRRFSRAHNFVLMVAALAFGWSLAWLIGMLIAGPDGESAEVQAAFSQQLLRHGITTVLLWGMLLAMTVSGKIEARVARAKKKAAQAGKKASAQAKKAKPKKTAGARG